MPRHHSVTMTARLAGTALLALAAAACDDVLVAENLSNPDINRVFATPAAIEQTIGSSYQACHNSITNSNMMPEVLVLALESYSQLNNFNMGPRGAIPRNPILNQRGSPSVFTEFSSLSRAGRLAANALSALDTLRSKDNSPNDGVVGSAAKDQRARAFAFFGMACNNGWLAMIYDSAAFARPGMHVDSNPPLIGYKAVMDTALQQMDSAIAIASTALAASGFPTETAWLGGKAYSAADFIKVVRSYKARFRAGVARNRTERNAVKWDSVVADAEAGITEDFLVRSGSTSGWNTGFVVGTMFQDGRAWSQISLMYFGMADTTRRYDAWLALPLTARAPFLLETPDKRWPKGDTRDKQVTASVNPPRNNLSAPGVPYVAALAPDETAAPWGWSYYQFQRNEALRFNSPSSSGDWPEMMKAENDLLAAEGYIRLGDFVKAAAKIDITRVARGGLPSVAGIDDLSDPVPGGAGCVPRVPAPPAFTSTVCGNIMEAMKYEKRMETAYTSFGRWWIDGRGWGDLIEGTAEQYPVPFQEMNARQKTSYPLGGNGGSSAAPKGTYGF